MEVIPASLFCPVSREFIKKGGIKQAGHYAFCLYLLLRTEAERPHDFEHPLIVEGHRRGLVVAVLWKNNIKKYLEISDHTITKAYRKLKAMGWIDVRKINGDLVYILGERVTNKKCELENVYFADKELNPRIKEYGKRRRDYERY